MSHLYPKNSLQQLTQAIFETPTSEYRATPFWAWNCKLEEDELLRQIDIFKEMGFGGFHMHSRSGLDTAYLGDEFMRLVRSCVEKAKAEQLLAWLYDEDRWPSGYAGGMVTQNPDYRARYLLVTPYSYAELEGHYQDSDIVSSALASRTNNGRLLGCFDVVLDEKGCLAAYRMTEADESVAGQRWYAYLETFAPNPRFNYQTYVNTLDKHAIQLFLQTTHERYKRWVGESFGSVIPAIFTDEPQFTIKTMLPFPKALSDVALPWTDDLEQSFLQTYGDSLLRRLPELLWELPDGVPSLVRYQYHDHIAERFAQAFADTCGQWCAQNQLLLTGHMLREPTLSGQTGSLGEAMRSYRSFSLPGIDMLCNHVELTTAKQAQSASRQYGAPGVLSELYGVTNWDFDFRGHKVQGDWQAALGVTVRVPHLSLLSMEGEAKRDYPASINYQSPWYSKYSYVEDHFARLNTALTRGKAIVRVGVVHPIESFWLHWGVSSQTSETRSYMEERFENITSWLLYGLIDFDFICESLLPRQCPQASFPLPVGEMLYDVVVVPGCETLRQTTLERLMGFIRAGGKVILAGSLPRWVDAQPSLLLDEFCRSCIQVSFDRGAILAALQDYRQLDIRTPKGERPCQLLYQLRQDGPDRWLFIAHSLLPQHPDVLCGQELQLLIEGCWSAHQYQTLDGSILPMGTSLQQNGTVLTVTLYPHDSLLLRLTPAQASVKIPQIAKNRWDEIPWQQQLFHSVVSVTLHEPNVCLLDCCQYSLDGEPLHPAEELLRIDDLVRERLGYPKRMEKWAQPWVIPPDTETHTLLLQFTIYSSVVVAAPMLALEQPDATQIRLNGLPVDTAVNGWFTDHAIRTVQLPPIHPGESLLQVKVLYHRRMGLEWYYLLGDFGVTLQGRLKTLCAPVSKLGFGDITTQGLPFYGGNITYHLYPQLAGQVRLRVPHYRGNLLSVELDGKEMGNIAYAPYEIALGQIIPGQHTVDITLYGNRVNCFGSVHNCNPADQWYAPRIWRTQGDAWTYEYCLRKCGILNAPQLLSLAE